jgi:hypothetical protein
MPAAGIDGPGKMLYIMGTSGCHLVVGTSEVQVPGICGVVEDGMLPGFFAYEAGQCCLGDHYAWFVDNCLPASYMDEAKSRKMNPHALLREKIGKLTPGKSGQYIRIYVIKPGASTWMKIATVKTTSITASGGARYSHYFKPGHRGTYRIRVKYLGTTALAASTSRTIKLRVY